jgi:hypothetical protein
MKHLLEDYGCIQGTIDPTLASNSYTESMVKVRNIAHSCMNPECDVRPTMTLVINEIVHALQLEEGQMGYNGATKTEILQCPSQSKSCSSLGDAWRETKLAGKEAKFPGNLEIPFAEEPDPWWRQIFENTKEKSKQQPKKRITYCHSSRSVLQTVLIYQLEKEMTGSNNLCHGIMKGLLINLLSFHCRD